MPDFADLCLPPCRNGKPPTLPGQQHGHLEQLGLGHHTSMAHWTHVPYPAEQRHPPACGSRAAFYHHLVGKSPVQGSSTLWISGLQKTAFAYKQEVESLEGMWVLCSTRLSGAGTIDALLPMVRMPACARLTLFLPLSQLSEGNVLMTVYRANSRVSALRLHQVKVNDGDWHHMQLELRSSRDNPEAQCLATMAFDYGLHQVWGAS